MALDKMIEREMIRAAAETLNFIAWRISMAEEEQADSKPTPEELTQMWRSAHDAERSLKAILDGEPGPYMEAVSKMLKQAEANAARRAP